MYVCKSAQKENKKVFSGKQDYLVHAVSFVAHFLFDSVHALFEPVLFYFIALPFDGFVHGIV